MFKIIGGDQREYGPITVEDVRRWIQEGRLSGHSLAWIEGSPDWKPLSSYPEFADALRTQSTQPSFALVGGSPGAQQAWTNQLLASRPQLQIGECLSRSWELLKSNFALLFGA